MSPHPGVVLDSAKKIDTTIPVGTRVVLVEDHRNAAMAEHCKAGMRLETRAEFSLSDEAIESFGGYYVADEAGRGFWVNASAVRRESEVDAPKVDPIDRMREALRTALHEATAASAAIDRSILGLQNALADVFEVVPSGQPVTRMCHDDSLVAAPGVTLRECEGEPSGERGRS